MPDTLTSVGDWVTAAADGSIGMPHRFTVVIGRFPLGGWTTVSGITMTCKATAIQQLGFNTYNAQLLDPPDWTPIVLERVVFETEWLLTYQYIADALAYPPSPVLGMGANPANSLVITINNAWGDPVRAMHFSNCRPTKWEAPKLSAASTTAAAIEKLTLVHDGLFPDGPPETSP